MFTEQQYIRLLEDKQRLSTALTKLQTVSQRALVEFSELRKKYLTLNEHYESLKNQSQEWEQRHSIIDGQLKHSEFMIQKLVGASRDAISEFNDLKTRYSREVERRKEAEQQVYQYKLQIETLSSKQISSQSSTAGVGLYESASRENIERELASVQVQLKDTLEAFQEYREQTMRKQEEIEQRIHEEFQKLQPTTSDPMPSTEHRQSSGYASKPSPNNKDSTIPAAPQIQRNTNNHCTVDVTKRHHRNPPPPIPPKKHAQAFQNDETTNTQAKLTNQYDSRPASVVNHYFDIPTGHNLSQNDSETTTTKSSQNVNRLPASRLRDSLLDTNNRMKDIINKRSSRVLEAAGRRAPGSEYDIAENVAIDLKNSVYGGSGGSNGGDGSVRSEGDAISVKSSALRSEFVPATPPLPVPIVPVFSQQSINQQRQQLKSTKDRLASTAPKSGLKNEVITAEGYGDEGALIGGISDYEEMSNNQILNPNTNPRQDRRESVQVIENLFAELESELGTKL